MSDGFDQVESTSRKLKNNARVRLIDNPTRTGRIGTEHIGSGRRERLHVYFDDGTEDHFPASALAEVPKTISNSPYAWFSEGCYGHARHLRTAITHHRLSGKLANLIYSLNTTNTDFYPHQFKPVLQLLESPCNAILIADEVGLGKTIEAGLIWTELKARVDARRLLVVCPAVLRTKWKEELLHRFGVRAQLVDANELVERLKQVQKKPREEFALIASMQGLRPPKNYSDPDNNKSAAKLARFLEEVDVGSDSLFNFVVIDEAHYLRNSVTSTNTLGFLLRPHAEYLALLSATPLQTSDTDLFNLLKLIDESAFPHENSYQISMNVTRPIIQLRDAVLAGKVDRKYFVEVIDEALKNPFLEGSSQLSAMRENPPTNEEFKIPALRAELADKLDRVHPLSKVVTRTLKREVQENRVIRVPQDYRAKLSDNENFFYEQVTHHVREFCQKNDLFTGFILTIPQRQMASSIPAACRAWQEKINHNQLSDYEEALYDISSEDTGEQGTDELGKLVKQLVVIANNVGSYEKLKANDSKYKLLLKNLKRYMSENPGKKIVLFSFFRQTLLYLNERLLEDGFDCLILQGGDKKDEVLSAFKDELGAQILLSSEVGAEGVDLQFSSLLINYDLPWNPMKVEQRIGRIDRLGQKAERILIWNFMYSNTIDERIYDRLLMRLDVFRQALGNMESIIGRVVNKITRDLFTHHLTSEEELQRIDQNLQVLEENKLRHRQLEQEAPNLIAHGDFITGKIRAAKELGRYINSEDLMIYVRDFLSDKYPATRFIPLDEEDKLFQIEPDVNFMLDFSAFIDEKEINAQTQLLKSRQLPIFFENKHKNPLVSQERVTQEHPLVRFVSSKSNQSKHTPVAAVQILSESIFDDIPCGEYIFCVKRWGFSGAQTSERLVYSAKEIHTGVQLSEIDSEKMVNQAALRGEDWFAAANILCPDKAAEAYEQCRNFLDKRYEDIKLAMINENNDRINLQINILANRNENEIARINEQICNLKRAGKLKTIPMLKGKIKVAEERYNQQKKILETKKNLQMEDNAVIAGVVRIN